MNKRIYEIEYFAVSDIGKIRANHEDNFLLPTGELITDSQVNRSNPCISFEGTLVASSTDVMHFAVGDGMGGHNAGEIASSMVVNKLKDFVSKWHPVTMDRAVKEYKKFVFELNSAVHSFGKTSSEYSNLGSTLASVVSYQNKAVAVNVGDSRVYSFTADGLKRLSKDHTEMQMLIDYGIIDNENDNLCRARNSLTRFIGMAKDSIDELYYVSPNQDIRNSDIFMICSDGLTGVVNDGHIEKILEEYKDNSLSFIGNKLVEASFDTTLSGIAGCDNVTIILFKFTLNGSKKIKWRSFKKLFRKWK